MIDILIYSIKYLHIILNYVQYNTHWTVVMLRLYLSLSPGLASSACSQVTVTLVSLSAVTLTSSGGLGNSLGEHKS